MFVVFKIRKENRIRPKNGIDLIIYAKHCHTNLHSNLNDKSHLNVPRKSVNSKKKHLFWYLIRLRGKNTLNFNYAYKKHVECSENICVIISHVDFLCPCAFNQQ